MRQTKILWVFSGFALDGSSPKGRTLRRPNSIPRAGFFTRKLATASSPCQQPKSALNYEHTRTALHW